MSHCLWPPWTVVHHTLLPIRFFQARVLEYVAIFFSRGSSQPRDWTLGSCGVSCIAGDFFTAEPLGFSITCSVLLMQRTMCFHVMWNVLILWYIIHTLDGSVSKSSQLCVESDHFSPPSCDQLADLDFCSGKIVPCPPFFVFFGSFPPLNCSQRTCQRDPLKIKSSHVTPLPKSSSCFHWLPFSE